MLLEEPAPPRPACGAALNELVREDLRRLLRSMGDLESGSSAWNREIEPHPRRS